MASGMPSVIDLDAELATLTIFRRTPHSTREETKGSVARLASYRDGLLLALKSAGTDHWERHLTGDELVHVLDGSTTLEIVCDDGPPKSFTLGPGMIAVIPQGAWHRSHSEGNTHLGLTPFPREHHGGHVDDPRRGRKPEGETETRAPDIIDLNAEVAKLTMFQGRRPRSTMADRQGSAARLRLTVTAPSPPRSSRERSLGKAHCRRADPYSRRHGNAGRRGRGGAAIARAPRGNDDCHPARDVAPVSLCGGRDADDRDPLSQRDDRGRSRRPSNGREQSDVSEEFAASFSLVTQVCLRRS